MLVMMFVVTGIFSFRELSVDLLPKADPATVQVSINLPGASPDELNSSVVEPTEQSLSSIAGIDEMNARIFEGQARIILKFILERDINDAAQDVREKVAQAIKDLPPEVEPPVITKVDPDADPVISFALSGPLGIRALTEIADKQIRRGIETVDGVGEVTISGGHAREIHIVLDIGKLNAHGLTVDKVRDAIVSENVEIPGGRIQQGDAELTLRTLGRLESSEQFTNVVVATGPYQRPIMPALLRAVTIGVTVWLMQRHAFSVARRAIRCAFSPMSSTASLGEICPAMMRLHIHAFGRACGGDRSVA